ncbi:prostaglandin D2 receptor-like [Pseudophryne corroboree]|uniref:prostaglandin D2 receptor-like n=1 Tax=Pseudophryne corroboree TaxID=495146 RepID=UPI00308172CB
MELYPCSNNSRAIQGDHSVIPSSLLFSTGLLGNFIAIYILWQHKLRTRNKTSIFYILVTGLTVTNLMGKCLLSPMVLAAYSKNQTLVQMADNRNLCNIFSFIMIFFGLAPMLILFAMALDCWIALAYPFFYYNYITKKIGLVVPLVVYIFSAGFCAMPFLGIGKFKQYCPGTWCFIQMTAEDSKPDVLAYSVLYGTVMGIFVIAIIICNVAIMRRLYQMYQIQNQRNMSGSRTGPKVECAKQAGMEELDHLILLAVMTIIFAVCSLPLTVRVYIAAFTAGHDEYADLLVIRFISMNSIVDPWIFIIFRTSKFHTHVHRLCSRINSTTATQTELLDTTTKLDLKLEFQVPFKELLSVTKVP